MKRFLLVFSICLLLLPFIHYPQVQAKSKIDIVFIIDRSGSMGGEINAVKNNISDFANLLENEGIDYQLGLLSYERTVTRYPLTKDVDEFKRNLSNINVSGGIENGLDAIVDAINNYTYELNSSKYFIIIGDEPIYSDRGYSNSQVKQMLINNDITVTEISTSSSLFGGLYQATGGQYLNINANFADHLTSIFDEIQAIPTLEVISPSQNQYLSEYNSAFIPQVRVSDPDSDILTFYFYIDDESTPRDTKSITNTQTAQTISFSALDIGTLSEGQHKMVFKVDDGSDTVQDYVNFTVDKTAPTLGTINMTSTDTSINITGSATDSIAGMEANPYKYTVGSTVSAWTSNTTYTKTGLTPNTAYTAKFEAKDKVGHIATKQQTIYTKAQVPVISVTNSSETSLELSLTDQNPAITQYQIKAGTKYVTLTGALTTTPVWLTTSTKKITVTGLTANTSYSFSAKAKNQAGIETSFSTTKTGTTLAKPPVNVSTDVTQTSIRISWAGTSGATGYDIEADGQIIHNGTSTSYNHSNLNPNTQHSYRVRVINSGGIGQWSPTFTASTLPDPPDVPTGLNTTPVQTKVTITWDRIAEAESYDIEVDGTIINNGNLTTYIHEGLTPLTEHTYRVRAKNAGGISDWSHPVVTTTLPYPPETPNNVVGNPLITTVTIIWEQIDGADAYEIEVDGLILDNGPNTTYTHEGLQPLSGHTYRVRAKNAGGKSLWSSPLNITTHPEKPNIPTNIMTTAEQESITLTWYKVAHAESYDIEIDSSQIINITQPQYVHSGLQPDSEHTYRVRAINISGKSEWSIPVTMPTFPSDFDPTTSLTNVIAIVTNNEITISWDTVAYEAEYEVEVDGVLTDNGKDTIYHHGGLEPNQYHIYKIRLKNEEGTGDWVAILSLSTLSNPPDAPGNIEAYADNYSIELRWEMIEGATGYDLEIDGVTVDAGNVPDYIHTELDPGTSHTYRLRAKNITGVTAWSPAIEVSTTSPTYIVNGVKDQEFAFSLLASNVQDFSELSFIVIYDPNQMELVDLYNFTPENNVISEGVIPGTNLYAVYTPGRIEFKVNQNIVPGTSWSGELSTILFISKIDGQAFIDFVVK